MVEDAAGPEPGATAEDIKANLLALHEEVNKLRQRLQAEEARSKENLDLAKRIQADFDNYKKRVAREKEETVRCANDKLIAELLGVVDDLERATGSAGKGDVMRQGVEQVRDNLKALLCSYGLREITNQSFDPQFHEAFTVGEGEEGKIIEVYQKGYCLGPRVLRHSKVKVGKKTDRGENDG